MDEHFINIGEYYIGSNGGKMVCRGLGSCIALFLYDRTSKVSGGAHIFLPDNLSEDEKTDADMLVSILLSGMHDLGANPKTLRAQIVGGASMFRQDSMQIGQRNISKVKKLLLENKIFLAQDFTGGGCSRSAEFNMSNGKLEVKSY